MKCRQQQRSDPTPFVCAFGLLGLALAAGLCIFAASSFAHENDQEPPLPEPEAPAAQPLPDSLLPQIQAAMEAVTTTDATALAKALHIGEALGAAGTGSPPKVLRPIGDMDGDGVPEMLLQWAIPDVTPGEETAPTPDAGPLWAIYLLSWDGAHWKTSRLMSEVADFNSVLIDLGPPVGRAVAVVAQEGDPPAPHPAIFQLKDHMAMLLWDAQADDSRFQPLLEGRVSFREHAGARAEMVVTGRADPGLLQVAARGHRGFQVRTVYHWDGKAFIPARSEYSASQDYTLYRFISALHLHDYASAYALVVPAKFLNTHAPTLDAFRQFIQNNWPEFLEDEVFEAPDPPPGSRDEHFFLLAKANGRKVYHPIFSSDGKFLLTGLTRTEETLPAEP